MFWWIQSFSWCGHDVGGSDERVATGNERGDLGPL